MTHQEIRTLANTADTYAAIEAIANSGDSLSVAKQYLTLVTELYWKAKDLTHVMALGAAGITFGLTRAVAESDTDTAEQLRGTAKAIAYNLGSFCWPGWAEPRIDVGQKECAFGYDAARCNLRLAIELKRPPKAMSNAHWLVGAHELARRDFDRAIESFEKAKHAETRAMDLMADGYRELAVHLQSDGRNAQPLEAAKTALLNEGSEDAKAFAEQLTTVEAALREWYAR
jgi:tetratricopeptide (TPR) repeat protein